MHLCRTSGANHCAGSGEADNRSSRGFASGLARGSSVAVTGRQTGGFARRVAGSLAGPVTVAGSRGRLAVPGRG